jgi:hypothetical protein
MTKLQVLSAAEELTTMQHNNFDSPAMAQLMNDSNIYNLMIICAFGNFTD